MNQRAARNLRKLAKEDTATETPIVAIHESRFMVGGKFPTVATIVSYPERRRNYQTKKAAYSGLNHIQRGIYNAS